MVIINGRGIVQYTFEATVDEELTVDRGEEVCTRYHALGLSCPESTVDCVSVVVSAALHPATYLNLLLCLALCSLRQMCSWPTLPCC